MFPDQQIIENGSRVSEECRPIAGIPDCPRLVKLEKEKIKENGKEKEGWRERLINRDRQMDKHRDQTRNGREREKQTDR